MFLVIAASASASGYASKEQLPALPETGFSEQTVWALNVGGAHFESRAGEVFLADDCSQGGAPCAQSNQILRTQNPSLYQSFREGHQRYSRPIPNGIYSVALFFNEASEEQGSDRIFDVLIEGATVLKSFNVYQVAGSATDVAVTRTIADIEVTDGTIDIELASPSSNAVLSGFAVRASSFAVGDWQITWSDEFLGPKLDTEVWTPELWDPAHVNNEDQTYTQEAKNLRLENGVLVMEAHHEGDRTPKYSSARIHSAAQQDLTYGRVDIRARVPEGQGLWPALWLFPTDPYRYATKCSAQDAEVNDNARCDAWPNSGEIDLMEHVGHEPGIVHGTVHTRDYYFKLGNQIGQSILLPDLGEEFHTYSLVWGPSALGMYVDSQRYFTYVNDGEGFGQWPFDHAFHVILNLAVGGDWGRAGGPVDNSVFPQRLEVDFVRLYKPRTTGM
ncbi:family 16 glycosylhydrolase [Congregibacter brevis]|uniref:Family 16 glycosylhydrolase n=1 Tax=Congregibacter brevis TaxID=3081201 RepID=A0ABZ0II28_9GAMM|nr:family 16 glycosylhydrolase [Congregibacter sp. IMCC45268]